jgi:cation transport ATPase
MSFDKKEVKMEREKPKTKRSLKYHNILEWFFCLATYTMTFITFSTAIVAFWQPSYLEILEINANLYFVCIILYAGARQIRKRLYPETAKERQNEFVVTVWIILAIVLAVIATFIERKQMELFKEVVFITTVVASILAGGEVLKHILEIWFGTRQK